MNVENKNPFLILKWMWQMLRTVYVQNESEDSWKKKIAEKRNFTDYWTNYKQKQGTSALLK